MFCMKDADQLRGKFVANQCLCVCCIINIAISDTLILNNFQESTQLKLYSPVCIGPGPGQRPRIQEFSQCSLFLSRKINHRK